MTKVSTAALACLAQVACDEDALRYCGITHIVNTAADICGAPSLPLHHGADCHHTVGNLTLRRQLLSREVHLLDVLPQGLGSFSQATLDMPSNAGELTLVGLSVS